MKLINKQKEGHPFYDKLKAVFDTKEFKEFSKEFLNEDLSESSSVFFIYFFSIYVKGKNLIKDEPELNDVMNFLNFLVHDPEYRKLMVNNFKNSNMVIENKKENLIKN